MLNFCNTIFIHIFYYYTALIIIFDFFQKISHNIKNQELSNFNLVLQSFILSGLFSKTVRLSTIIFILYQLLPQHFSLFQNQN